MAKKVSVNFYVEAKDVAQLLAYLDEWQGHAVPYEVQVVKNWQAEKAA